jgi:hypothetical protein
MALEPLTKLEKTLKKQYLVYLLGWAADLRAWGSEARWQITVGLVVDDAGTADAPPLTL